jgi:hypothetical protein
MKVTLADNNDLIIAIRPPLWMTQSENRISFDAIEIGTTGC